MCTHVGLDALNQGFPYSIQILVWTKKTIPIHITINIEMILLLTILWMLSRICIVLYKYLNDAIYSLYLLKLYWLSYLFYIQSMPFICCCFSGIGEGCVECLFLTHFDCFFFIFLILFIKNDVRPVTSDDIIWFLSFSWYKGSKWSPPSKSC